MEGDAGSGQLEPTGLAVVSRSRLASRGWSVGVCATLLVLAVAMAAGGYFASRSHDDSRSVAAAEAAAMAAAKDCVTATQAPDTSAMEASQRKIIDCATGDFSVQATLYSGVLVDAYQVAKAQVQVSDMRAAVERHNADGSMDILVALRVSVSNSAAQNQEVGYRLRVRMAKDNGTYKIAQLDQVTEVTAILGETPAASVPTQAGAADNDAEERPASWPARAGAFVVDVLFGMGVIAAMMLVVWSTAAHGWLWWLCVSAAAIVLLSIAVNRLLLPVVTGWSLGRALTGITVVRADGAAVGPWRLLVRDIAHLLDTLALFVGWLWPLWDRRGRTFADLLVGTEVRRHGPSPARAPRIAVAAVSVAAALAVAAAALGYVVVYRHDLRVGQAREQIAVQGPKIVEDMLSYDPTTLQADFARAQSLVTDGYRPQLVAQQQAVRQANVVANEYWVTNSAVLTSTERDATMLILMQGQRGVAPDERTITATVRVGFEKSGDGRWQVAALSVLTKPKPAGGGQ